MSAGTFHHPVENERIMDFPGSINDNARAAKIRISSVPVPDRTVMTKSNTAPASAAETDQERFSRILLRAPFKALKDVLEKLNVAVPVMHGALLTTNTYQMFLAKIGYRVEVVKQIHENDCYARLGTKGGIRAVLPLHDIATYSSRVSRGN